MPRERSRYYLQLGATNLTFVVNVAENIKTLYRLDKVLSIHPHQGDVMRTRLMIAVWLAVLGGSEGCDQLDRASKLPTDTIHDPASVAQMNPENLRRLEGVDRLPMPAERSAIAASMQRHWPSDPRAQGASVTVDVTVDATGHVTVVKPVYPTEDGMPSRIVLRERDGSERVKNIRRDPSAEPAAAAVLRDVQFTPALRDGQPVAHTFRMTITFSRDAQGRQG